MKIGDKNGVETSVPVNRTGAYAGRAARTAAAACRVTDSVEVSDAARALIKLVASGVSTDAPDPARAAQVALLRNAVATGRYQPDLHEVARKLLAEVGAELLG